MNIRPLTLAILTGFLALPAISSARAATTNTTALNPATNGNLFVAPPPTSSVPQTQPRPATPQPRPTAPPSSFGPAPRPNR